jgi:hypothetical protein
MEDNKMLINAESIKQIVKRIACRGDDDGERFTDTARVDAIAECLKNSQWQIFHDGELAKIYAHQKFDATRPVVVVSSHVDMVAEQCYAICDGEFWKGSFDNLITNAVVVSCMIENVFDGNVLVAFTGDEEEDGGGACEVAEMLSEKGVDVKYVVVTDVTEEGWRQAKALTIENVLPEDDLEAQQEMVAMLKRSVIDIDNNPLIIVDGEPDEAWEYDEFDLPCCSVCMPCCGDMHSEEGVGIRSSKIGIYANALISLVNARLIGVA